MRSRLMNGCPLVLCILVGLQYGEKDPPVHVTTHRLAAARLMKVLAILALG
jgi:hypothetical protein